MIDLIKEDFNMTHEIKQDKKKKPKDNAGSGFQGQPPRLEIPSVKGDKRLAR
jgi:hypothetical protein